MKNKILENIKELFNRNLAKGSNKEVLDPSDRESRSYNEIKAAYEKLRNLLTDENVKLYIAGGFVPYLLLNQDSNRLHDDIDAIIPIKDIESIRKVFKKSRLYNPYLDSKNFAKDGQDYGFDIVINKVPVGIYPFTYDGNKVTQYNYDAYTKQCKIKEFEVEKLSDYVMEYTGLDGRKYNAMSLEYIKLSKEKAARPKDILDCHKIDEYGIRKNVYDRLNMYKTVQDTKAEKLSFIKNLKDGAREVSDIKYSKKIEKTDGRNKKQL